MVSKDIKRKLCQSGNHPRRAKWRKRDEEVEIEGRVEATKQNRTRTSTHLRAKTGAKPRWSEPSRQLTISPTEEVEDPTKKDGGRWSANPSSIQIPSRPSTTIPSHNTTPKTHLQDILHHPKSPNPNFRSTRDLSLSPPLAAAVSKLTRQMSPPGKATLGWKHGVTNLIVGAVYG